MLGTISSEISYQLRGICAVGMLLHINGNFTMRKLQSSLVVKFRSNRMGRSRFEAYLSVSVVSFEYEYV